MTFMHTGLALAGIACVAIPILIHLLLRRRRKPITWGAMRFLMEAYRRQRRKLKLQQLILLMTRCLVILLLALAIGRPLLEAAGLLGGAGGRDVIVLIDNGIASSMRTGESVSPVDALERHKAMARTILDQLGPADRAGLIVLGAPAQSVVVPPSSDVNAVGTLIDELKPTDAGTDLSGAISTLASALKQEDDQRRTVVAVISDFLVGSGDIARPLPVIEGLGPNVSLLVSSPLESAPTNVQITAVEPLSPVILTGSGGISRGEHVRISLRRTGPGVTEGQATTLRVHTRAGETESVAPPVTTTVRWEPGQTETTASVRIDTSAAQESAPAAETMIIAEIDRDTIGSDNAFVRPIDVREAMRVGLVARRKFSSGLSPDKMTGGDWLRLALNPGGNEPVDVLELEPSSIDAPTLAGLDAVMLPAPDLLSDEAWDRIGDFARAGGFVFVSPPAEATVHLWSDSMLRALGLEWRLGREPVVMDPAVSLASEQPQSSLMALLAGELADLIKPVTVSRVLPVEEAPPEARVILRLSDDRPWVIAQSPGKLGGEAEENGGHDARGMVVFLASAPALGWTDLPARPLMVPLVAEIVRRGFGESRGAWTSVAGRTVTAPSRTARLIPTGAAGGALPLTVARGGISAEPARHTGVLRAVETTGRTRGYVAVNADVDGARTATQPQSGVSAWLSAGFGGAANTEGEARSVSWMNSETAGAAIGRDEGGSPFSGPLLIAAVVLALIETVLARLFSHAVRESSSNVMPVRAAA